MRLPLSCRSANWMYFNPAFNSDYAGLNVVASKGTAGQIDDLIDGRCNATELTREDLYKWTAGHQDHQDASERETQCRINVVGEPIKTRSRGFMMESSSVCLQVGVNALYQSLGAYTKQQAKDLGDAYGYVTEPIAASLDYDVCGVVDVIASHQNGSQGTQPIMSPCNTFMNVGDLKEKFFNNPECPLLEIGAKKRIQISAGDLSGIFYLYSGMVGLSLLMTAAGLDSWEVCQEAPHAKRPKKRKKAAVLDKQPVVVENPMYADPAQNAGTGYAADAGGNEMEMEIRITSGAATSGEESDAASDVESDVETDEDLEL